MPRTSFVIVLLSLLTLYAGGAVGTISATLTVTDPVAYHAHTPGSIFTVQIEAVYSGTNNQVFYQWLTANGHPLTSKVALPTGVVTNVNSPDNNTGYIELSFTAASTIALPNRNPGEPLSFGFVRYNPRGTTVNPASHFGSVHSNVADPYIPSWVKTIWWNGTPASYWGSTIASDASSNGKLVLGMFAVTSLTDDVSWTTTPDDTAPITQTQLNAIQSVAELYLAGYANGANSNAAYIELGLEENLSPNFGQTYYFENLASKIQVMKAAAAAVGASNVKFIYQVVQAFSYDSSLHEFLSSVAYPHIDILSIHVYAWANFPTPESYLPSLMTTVNGLMGNFGVKPIWFTECGIPQNDPPVTGFNDGGALVGGGTKGYCAAYMIKLHVIAFSYGVQKIFWYQYQNQEFNAYNAEDNAGMIDSSGFPLPTYASQWIMVNLLDSLTYTSSAQLSNDAWFYLFESSSTAVYVVWTYPNVSVNLALSSLKSGLVASQISNCYDKVARSCSSLINSGTNVVTINGDPIFLVVPLTTKKSPSPSGTVVVGTSGSIVDSNGNTWTINSAGQVAKNGVADKITENVLELAYVSGVVWQENINHLWWSWVSNTWTPTAGTSTSPLTSSPSGTVVVGTSGHIVDNNGNVWTINTAGQVAQNGVADMITENVLELAYVSGIVWQENINHLWWSWVSNTWIPTAGTSTNPLASPSGTVVVGTSGHIVDNNGNVWTINTAGQVAQNGVADTITENVLELAYVSGVVWQENVNHLWWSWVSNTWTPTAGTATSPL